MPSYLVLLFIRKIDSLSGGPFGKFDEMQSTLKADVVFEALNIEHCWILAELPGEGTRELKKINTKGKLPWCPTKFSELA